MLYLLCVVVTAYYWGLGPSIIVSIISVLVFDFFHVPPYLTFRVADTQYVFTFLALLSVAIVVSYLTMRVRRQTESAERRERQTAALYALGKDLAISNDIESYIQATVHRARETFGRKATIYLPDPQNKRLLKPYSDIPDVSVDENETAAAIWAFEHQKIVGHGTDTLPNATACYFPMVTARGAVGVLALSSKDMSVELTIEQERILEAYADLAAIAIESILLNTEKRSS
jgi:two-component system, OmpR family, sensor histidine kinase KdpD